jgi:hypothetical protein
VSSQLAIGRTLIPGARDGRRAPTAEPVDRAALIRNLRALGRRKEIAVLCRTLLRPRGARFPTLVFQRECAAR